MANYEDKKFKIKVYLKNGLLLETWCYHEIKIEEDFLKYLKNNSQAYGEYKLDQKSPSSIGTADERLVVNFEQVEAVIITKPVS